MTLGEGRGGGGGGGGGGNQARDVSDVHVLKNGFHIPTTLDINDVMGGWGGGGGSIMDVTMTLSFPKYLETPT